MIKKISIFILVLILAIIICIDNTNVGITKFDLNFKKLPATFNGFKIVHLSDLHISSFGDLQKKIVSNIQNIKPNIIVITGDLVNGRNYNEIECIKFIDQITKIAPVYFVSGNHEWYNYNFSSFSKLLKDKGVVVLQNSSTKIARGQDEIVLVGIEDPEILSGILNDDLLINDELNEALAETQDDRKFKLLLSHRPEFFDLYSEKLIDLTLSGHAHGGQIRLPFIGGIYAPNQGLFPKYTTGLYSEKSSQMIVSRGLGNSLFPLRINNPPEIVLISLYN